MKGIFLVIWILLISSIGILQAQPAIKPVSKQGIIDLRSWNFERDGSLLLNGEWEFYWMQLINHEDFKLKSDSPDLYVKVPSRWNDLIVDGSEIQSFGYATYRLKILGSKNQKLEIAIPEEMTAYNFFVEGNLIFSCGIVSDDKSIAKPREYPIIREFELWKDTTEIIFQVSNYHHREGGLTKSPKIGLKESLDREQDIKIGFDLFLFGSILIMSFYHFGLFFMRREKSAALFFGLFTFVLAVRTLFTGTKFIYTLFPDLSWFLKYRIEYLTLFLSPIFIISFLYKIYKKEISKRFVIVYGIICMAYTSITLFPPAFFSVFLLSFQLLILLAIAYLFKGLIQAIQNKRYGARILFSSIVVLFISIINDILLNQGIITNTIELVPFGTFVFVLGQSLVLAKIFTGAFYENEVLAMELDYQNKHLEQIIDQRSREVENQKISILEINEELTLQNEEIQSINEHLEQQKIRLQESELKFRSLVELLPEAIFEIDSQGRIVYANDMFFHKLNFDLSDLNKGLNINSLLIPQHQEQECRLTLKLNEIMPERKVIKELEFFIKRNDGSFFPILLSVAYAYSGEQAFYRCVFIDISQRVENESRIKMAYQEIHKQNKDITDSIHYALTIQRSILPSIDYIADLFEDFFIINKPHSIVSGDFYYFIKHGSKIVFSLGDCTGHGVPGGFMTMLGITQLNDIYGSEVKLKPDEALEIMRNHLISSLGQVPDDYGSKDGMEMFLGILDTETLVLEYASANEPLHLLRNGEFFSYKGDRMPVGIYRRMEKYCLNRIQLQKDDILYLYSDGVVDLFGGEKERRLYSKGLQEIIMNCYNETMTEQGKIIDEALIKWQGSNKQTDDMLMIGLKI